MHREEPAVAQDALGTPEWLRLLVDSVRDSAIFLLEPNGNVASWNRGAERMKGYTAAEVLGCHVSTFYAPDDAEAGTPQHALERALQDGTARLEGELARLAAEDCFLKPVDTERLLSAVRRLC